MTLNLVEGRRSHIRHKSGAAITSPNDPLHGEALFSTKKRAKGIHRAAVAKNRQEQYKAQLDQPEETYVPNSHIGSNLHQIYGNEVWT